MQVTANSTHNAELLKAMRGAGTVFGVVVELTLRLRDVSGLYGGYLVALDDGRGSSFKWVHGSPPPRPSFRALPACAPLHDIHPPSQGFGLVRSRSGSRALPLPNAGRHTAGQSRP